MTSAYIQDWNSDTYVTKVTYCANDLILYSILIHFQLATQICGQYDQLLTPPWEVITVLQYAPGVPSRSKLDYMVTLHFVQIYVL